MMSDNLLTCLLFCGIIIHKGDDAMSNTSKLSDVTASKIKSMIEDEGRFSVGDKLPNENDFASELGVSVQRTRKSPLFASTAKLLSRR